MEIKVNNQLRTYDEYSSLTVQQLLDFEMPDKQKGVAVAINNQVIPKGNWTTTIIEDFAEILIIRATQGG